MAFRVALADADEQFCALFGAHASRTDLTLVATAHDGLRALAAVREHHPDILVLDLIGDSRDIDGFQVLEALLHYAPRPKVLMLSSFAEEEHISRALALGADYCIMKPFDMATLMARVAQVAKPRLVYEQARSQERRCQVEGEVTRQLSALGVPAHYKGYAYLREAITMVIEDRVLLCRVTKELYPRIAERYGTSASLVERAMRNAVEVTWVRGDLATIEELFAYTVDAHKGKPTNSSFIARLADHVRVLM